MQLLTWGTMVDQELNALRREFLVEAEEKVREMESALANRSRESLERLAYLAHQLKGSGGSYGYQRISSDAAELEKMLESQAQKPEQIATYVQKLRTEIATRTKELTT